jgi:hypothetical protein
MRLRSTLTLRLTLMVKTKGGDMRQKRMPIQHEIGSSALLMKLAGLFERINDPLFVHRKMIILWETSHSFEKRKAYSSWEKSVKKCLLVHHHVEVPEAGVQVPAGTHQSIRCAPASTTVVTTVAVIFTEEAVRFSSHYTALLA